MFFSPKKIDDFHSSIVQLMMFYVRNGKQFFFEFKNKVRLKEQDVQRAVIVIIGVRSRVSYTF